MIRRRNLPPAAATVDDPPIAKLSILPLKSLIVFVSLPNRCSIETIRPAAGVTSQVTLIVRAPRIPTDSEYIHRRLTVTLNLPRDRINAISLFNHYDTRHSVKHYPSSYSTSQSPRHDILFSYHDNLSPPYDNLPPSYDNLLPSLSY